MKDINKLWVALGILALLSPIGLLASGTAWGEWGTDEFPTMLGYVPQGLARFSDLWRAPLPDYSIPGLGSNVGYIFSALVGMALVILVSWGIGKILTGKKL